MVAKFSTNLFNLKTGNMNYTLITPKGKIMTFYIKSMAELYQSLNGGTIICKSVLSSTNQSETVK